MHKKRYSIHTKWSSYNFETEFRREAYKKFDEECERCFDSYCILYECPFGFQKHYQTVEQAGYILLASN